MFLGIKVNANSACTGISNTISKFSNGYVDALYFNHLYANGVIGQPGQVLSTGNNIGDNNYWTTISTSGGSGNSNIANSANYIGTLPAANVVSNAQLQANIASVTALIPSIIGLQTTAGLAANVTTMTSNNTLFVGTVSAANVVSNTQLFSNLNTFSTTTLPANLISLGVINTTSNYTISGIHTYSANIIFQKLISANTNFGNTGSVLMSSGLTGNTYWSDQMQVTALPQTTTNVTITPTVTAGTYGINYVVGGILQFANILPSSFSGILESIKISFKASKQTGSVYACVFTANPSNGTYTNGAAATWNAADDQYLVGIYSLLTPLSPLGTQTIYNLDGIGKAIVGSSTSLYVVLITPTAFGNALASSSDMTVSLGLLQG